MKLKALHCALVAGLLLAAPALLVHAAEKKKKAPAKAGSNSIAAAQAAPAPVTMDSVSVPGSLGVNIHFTDPKPGEMEMLAQAGFKWIRMDFGWGGTERIKGQYDFRAFDRLLAALKPHGIRAIFILDYSNRNYDGGLSPHSEEGRAAFAKWAAAAAVHFKGQGILWEMYNEPNIQFWKPKPDVNQYIPLALAVGKALRAAAPGEQYIGPATSLIDFRFLEPCFRAGLLEYWSAVSVHPYRSGKGPETVMMEYMQLRAMIDQYAPKGKKIPIISGEWGFSAIKKITPEIQGKYLARQWLTNLLAGVPVSIWYDWHDDGTDPKENEHHFGTVLNKYYDGRDPVYDPKPAYDAAKTLTSVLDGFASPKRLDVGKADIYVVQFSQGGQKRYAVWTTAAQPQAVTVPGIAKGQLVGIVNLQGVMAGAVEAGAQGLTVTATDSPQYLFLQRAK